MRIVFMGTPEFAVPALEGLVSGGYDIAAVYTQPDRAAGRGRVLEEPPVKKTALKLGLQVLQPANLKSAGTQTQLADLKPDAIVVAAFGQILPPSVLAVPPFGCINIHPRCYRNTAAWRRCRQPFLTATDSLASASCYWIKVWIPALC